MIADHIDYNTLQIQQGDLIKLLRTSPNHTLWGLVALISALLEEAKQEAEPEVELEEAK